MLRKNIIIIILTLVSLQSYSQRFPIPTCDLAVSPTSFSLAHLAATNRTVNVTISGGTCGWTVSDNASWITLNSTSGTGTGSFTFNTSLNTSVYSRTGTITVTMGTTTKTITVTQEGAPPARPPAPTITKTCGNTVLTRAEPPTGVVYYWHTSYTGTSTSNSAKTWNRSVDGTVYLRGYAPSTNTWGISRTVSVDVNEIPNSYTVTGGGSYCSGGSGKSVGLSDSQTGINYQLIRNGSTNVGSPKVGTGSSLSFGNQTTAGTYTVKATTSTGCDKDMTGSATVVVNSLPVAYSVTGGGSYCSGGSGKSVGLSDSQTGVNYQLVRNGSTNVGSPKVGTGSALNFGNQTTEGTYTVKATKASTGCEKDMTGNAIVIVNPLAVVYTVTGGGSYCSGGSGVSVILSDSETSVDYQLIRNGSTNVGSPIAGNGLGIIFPNQTTAGTYTVKATTSTGCDKDMTGSATVVVNPLPVAYSVTGGGSYCIGGSGKSIGLSDSQTGVNYQLVRNGSENIGGEIAGTGNALNFGNQTIAGTYTVTATNASTPCEKDMSGSATVVVNTLPATYTVNGGGSYCSGGSGVSITLDDSETGISYQLVRDGSFNEGDPIIGNGLGLIFSNLTTEGTYTVKATNVASTCESVTSSVPISIDPLPDVPTADPIVTVCDGENLILTATPGKANADIVWYDSNNNAYTPDPQTGFEAGIYNVSNIDENQCESGTVQVEGIINPKPNQRSVLPVDPVCSGSNITLTSNELPFGPDENYFWYDGNGDTIGNAISIPVTINASETFSLIYKENNCESDPSYVTVSTHSTPIAPYFNETTKTVCSGNDVSLIVSNGSLIVSNGYEIKWLADGQEIDTCETLDITNAQQSKTYTVISYDPTTSCESDGVDITLNVNVTPSITITGETTVDFGETLNISASGADSYTWLDNNFKGETTGASTSILPEYDFSLTVIGETNGCPKTQEIQITVNDKPGTKSENFVKTIILQEPVQNDADIDIYSAKNIQSIQYFDDFGRTVQSTLLGQSPGGKDIVQFYEYDEFGRQAKSYLPFTHVTQGELLDDAATLQATFYNSQNIDGDKTHAYSEVVFDNTPYSRIIEASAPGETWNLQNGHTVKSEQGFNLDSDEVVWWTVNANGECVTYIPAHYSANTLYVNRTKNTNWTTTDGKLNTSETFTNKDGQTVLTRQFVEESGQVVEVNTYYVYDFYGRLSHVLSPEAIKEMDENENTLLTASILDKWVYSYNYDTKHRLIEKKIPGADTVVYVYDKLNRVILTQNGNLRDENQWSFVKYDMFGRSIITGLYTDGVMLTRNSMQAHVDGLTTDLFEAHTSTDNYGYTNNAFPNSSIDLLQVVYYDDYDYNNDGTDDESYADDAEYASNEAVAHTRGKLTGSLTKVLDGGNNWILTVPFYDKKGRTIQVYKKYDWNDAYGNEAVSGAELVNTLYDFSGKVLKTKLTHGKDTDPDIIIRQEFEYDHTGRLLNTYHQINNEDEVLLSTLEYNELGQVKEKNLHSTNNGAAFLQSVDYMYNIRGWITKLNNPDDLTNDGSGDTKTDLFAMNFMYADGTDITNLGAEAQYNGNIAAVKWSSESKTDVSGYGFNYDDLNRLTAAKYAVNDGTDWINTEENRYNMSVKGYDLNGNILGIDRFGAIDNDNNFAQIDDLNYFYNGNQLVGVNDDIADFTDILGDFSDKGAEAAIDIMNPATYEYTYDKNGNMTEDINKGIVVEYNHLNLPRKVVFDDNSSIEYIYAADGTKLRKSDYNSSNALVAKQDYIDGFVYTDQLEYFGTGEGRVVLNGTEYKYQYTFTDQVGSARLSFEDSDADGIAEVIQENHYYPFGMNMKGLDFNSGTNPFMYNSKELQDNNNLKWYDFGWRMQDPQLGVWHCIDPMAEMYYSQSPYHYVANNPINIVDPDGRSYSHEDFHRRGYVYRHFEGGGGPFTGAGGGLGNSTANGRSPADGSDLDWYTGKTNYGTAGAGHWEEETITQWGTTTTNGEKTEFWTRTTTRQVWVVDPQNNEAQSTGVDLGPVGESIRDRAGSDYAKGLFENYWLGKGDVVLTKQRFCDIVSYAKSTGQSSKNGVLVNFNGQSAIGVSTNFYNSDTYSTAFGVATIYYNAVSGEAIGFHDGYDFNKMEFGVRSFGNEMKTRAVNAAGALYGAQNYSIDFYLWGD